MLPLVLAAGGGAPLREDSRWVMRASGKVAWLRATPEIVWSRMTGDATTAGRRPDLTDKGGLAEIVELMTGREGIYRQSAHLEVDTEGKTPEQIATEILDLLGLISENPAPEAVPDAKDSA